MIIRRAHRTCIARITTIDNLTAGTQYNKVSTIGSVYTTCAAASRAYPPNRSYASRTYSIRAQEVALPHTVTFMSRSDGSRSYYGRSVTKTRFVLIPVAHRWRLYCNMHRYSYVL